MGRRAMTAALVAIALAACESAQPTPVEAPATGATTASAAPPAPATAAEAPAAQPDPSAVRAPEPVNPAVSAAASPRILYIKTAFANLRAGPTTAAKALGILKKGTRLEEQETRNQWHRVKLEDGREGWVAQSVASETPP